MTFSVTAAVDAYVEELEETREPDGMWHPSGLFGCERRAVYDFLGTPKDPLSPRTKRVFRIGHVFHELIQESVGRDKSIELAFPEVKIVDVERGIKGHADELIRLKNGRWVLLEFKSIRSSGMKYGDLPKEDHKKQTDSYVSVLRRHGGLWKLDTPEKMRYGGATGWYQTVEDDEVYLAIPPLGDLVDIQYAYVSKDDMEIREFSREFTAEDEAWLDVYLLKLKIHVAQGTLPKRLSRLTPTGNPSKQKHYLCGYCPFAVQCWDEDKEGVDLS